MQEKTAQFPLYFLRLGATGFGGPVALVERMRTDLVERRQVVSEEDFEEGLALAQIAPGPLAAQLAMYVGWISGRSSGAGLAGFAFVLPSLAIVLVLAAIYKATGGIGLLAGLFYGAGAAVIAVIARSGVRLARSTAKHDRILWTIVAVNALATVMLERESVLLVVASGLIVMIIRSRRSLVSAPGSLAVLFAPPVSTASESLLAIFSFFAAAGLVVFGSGLAIIPFLHGGVVIERQWLTERQFLDAVAVSLLTPGPVVITVAFIGSLVAGMAGGIVAAAAVFFPSWLIIVLAAPHFRRLKERAAARSFASGVTAAAVGALLGAVVVMGIRAITDVTTGVIAFVALALLVLRPRIPEQLILVAAGIAGLILTEGHRA